MLWRKFVWRWQKAVNSAGYYALQHRHEGGVEEPVLWNREDATRNQLSERTLPHM